MLGRKLLRNSRGDTIIEVLLAVAVMSMILAISYNLANKNSQYVRTAQERGEAQKFAEEQLERLRTYITPDTEWNPGNSCFSRNTGNPTANEGECRFGPDDGDGGRYLINLSVVDEDTYSATANWFALNGNEATLELSYRLPAPTPFVAPDKPICNDNKDNDEDDKTDHSSVNPINPDPGCDSPGDESEVDAPPPPPPPPPPVQFAVSRTSYTFPSRHLLISGGIKPTVDIVVSAPDGSRVSNVGSIGVTGGNTNSFSIISNNCSNRTLSPGDNCTVRIEFYPPSGGSNNYFGNSGWKQTTLRINGGDGSSTVNVSLRGLTYSDRLRPGDQITSSDFGPVPYKGGNCYINVEACGMTLTGIASNGNLYLGSTYCLWGGWGAPPYPGYGNRFAMQTDGNLVFYGIGGAYRYASWTFGNNLWLQVQDSGNGVYISNGSGGPLVKWIHYGGQCFAW